MSQRDFWFREAIAALHIGVIAGEWVTMTPAETTALQAKMAELRCDMSVEFNPPPRNAPSAYVWESFHMQRALEEITSKSEMRSQAYFHAETAECVLYCLMRAGVDISPGHVPVFSSRQHEWVAGYGGMTVELPDTQSRFIGLRQRPKLRVQDEVG